MLAHRRRLSETCSITDQKVFLSDLKMATTFYEGKVGASKAKMMISMMTRVIKMMIMNTNYYVLPGFMYLANSSKLILLSLFVSIAPKRSTGIKFLDRL